MVNFPTQSRWLKDKGFSKKEQEEIFEQCLLDVYNNPRWYLDNLEYMREFRVYWVNYKNSSITFPYKFCNENMKKPKAL
jgi:hypothetical protein